MIPLKLDWIKSNILVADINSVYGTEAGGCFLALLFNTAPHNQCFKKDSTRAVILQLGAIQLSSAAMHSFMIDVHIPFKLMLFSEYS